MAGRKAPDLAEALQKEGLDQEFWMLQFSKLGVKSKAALRHKEGDMDAFSKLQKETRYPWEKKALQELLKIDEARRVITKKRKTKREEAKDRLEKAEQEAKEKNEMEGEKLKKDAEKKTQEAKRLLQELEKARSDRKDRHDKRVQELEKSVREKMDVPPESWISSDKSLEELVSELEAQLERNSAALQDRDRLKEAVLLQKVSGGRALQGVLLTSNLEDQLKARACLLKLPDNVSIARDPSLKEDFASFSSKHQEDSYKTTVDILGHSVAVSAQAPVYGSIVIGGISESGRSETERTTNQNEQQMYLSTVKYSSMHVATYTFDNSDLKLSDDARKDLKIIIKTTKSATKANVQRACEKFFLTYGSHINQGPLRFGGNFWQTCSSKGFRTEETETVKELQSEAVTVSAGVSVAGFGISTEVGTEIVKGKFKGKCSKSTLASTRLVLQIHGGPAEVSNLSVWKAGLVANNSTWVLTDRGSKLVAVWDVIGRNHQKDLGKAREVLRKAWEEMTGLPSEPDFLPNLKYAPEDVLKEVSKWNKKDLTFRELQDNLLYLLQVKEDLLRKVKHPQYWVEEYLSQDPLQEFLSLVVESEEGFSSFGDIKFLMQQIIEVRDLKKLSTHTFPDIEHVSKWLYPSDQPSTFQINCEDFESFFGYLRKTLDELALAQLDASGPVLGSTGSASSSSISVATNVSLAIHSLRSNYQGTYEDILIVILAFPFQNDDSDNVITLNPLSARDLEGLLKIFTEEVNTAKETTPLQRQSLLFLLAVRIHERRQEGLFKLHLKKVSQMMEALDPPLEVVLKYELQAYLRGSYTLPQFQERLKSLTTTGHPPHFDQYQPPPGKGLSLQHILNTIAAIQSTVKSDDTILMSEKNPAAHTLFSNLCLSDHYHKKLGLQDALCIGSEPLEMSLNMSSPTEPRQLPLLILQKLVSFDYTSAGQT